MGQARDAAGNIWEIDDQGNPLRLIRAASSGQVFTLPQSPKDARQEARQAAADVRAERADQRAAAAEARAAAKYATENTMAPPPGDISKTGEDYLATLPTALAAQVRALADGRRAMPTGSALRSPQVQELVAAASQYDPTLDAANAATRVATRKDFTSGKAAQNITAINTALGHLGTLSQAAEKLGNRSIRPWNSIANLLETQSGDPRVKNFGIARDAVATELMRVFRGTGAGSMQEIEDWKRTIGSSDSPAQLRGEIAKAVELLNSRLEALGQQYNQGLGKSADPIHLLNPHAQNVFTHLGPGGDGIVPPDDTPTDGGGEGPDAGGPQTSAASGSSRTEYSPRASAQVDAMMNAGASYATINAALKKQNLAPISLSSFQAAKKWMKDNPGKQYFGASINKQIPLTAAQSFAGSAPGAFLAHAADQGTAGLVGALAGEKGRGALNAMSELHPDASLYGDVAGGVLGAAGTEAAVAARAPAALAKYAPRIADALYGSLTGYNQAEEGQGAEGAVLGAGAGLGGGLLGKYATRGLGAVARGVTDPAVQRLRGLGIPLTAGEVLGPGWKKAQDALTSVFGPGNMVARRYNEGRRALNEAAFNTAGDIVDTPINAVGQEGIDALNAAKSQAYATALGPVMMDVRTPSFLADRANVEDYINTRIRPVEGAQDAALEALVGRIDVPATAGMMTGRDFQEAYRGLARTGRERAAKDYGYETGQAMRQAQDALATALEEQNPGAYAGFLRANSANRHLNILADAVNAARNQVDDGEILFTPAQLGAAATNNAKALTGKIAAATGNRPFNQLALDAQQVMSSKLPESGTAPRWLMTGLATGGLTAGGGAAGYGLGGGEGAAEGGLGTLLLLTAGGSRPAQQILTKALADRPDWAEKIGLWLGKRAGLGGAVGAGTLPLTVGN